MHLALAALVPLALLVTSASAGLVPKAPRTSLDGSVALKREIQRRQVTTAALKKRSSQPKRKRQDPSQPVCVPPTIGQNVVVNGDFETGGSAAPFTLSSTGQVVFFGVSGGYGYGGEGQTNTALIFYAGSSGATGHAEQTVQVCAGSTYSFSVDVGRYEYTSTSCSAIVSVTVGGTTTTLYSGTPCVTEGCPLDDGNGDQFSRHQGSVGPFPSSGNPKVTYDVTCPAGAGNSNVVILDNFSLVRTA